MSLSEQQLISWSGPVSTTEDQKCKNALSQVTTAIKTTFGSKVSIFLQGSYRNNTNVRRDSDVDIVVRYDDVFFPDLRYLTEGQKAIYNANRSPAQYKFGQFKNDVHQILFTSFFGSGVKRKNKCIEVPGNMTRVTADVVPSFVHKRFNTATEVSAEGIEFFADDGTDISSFPEQHYRNGVAKTEATVRMYKRTVRILKNIRNKLIEVHLIPEDLAPSFFIECLVWNVPNKEFIPGNYTQTLRNSMVAIYNDMGVQEKYWNYAEVSDLKWLFRGSKRKPEDAKIFMQKCWDYAEFK